MSVLYFPGDGLSGVVTSALFGTWLFCDQFWCTFPRMWRGKRQGNRVMSLTMGTVVHVPDLGFEEFVKLNTAHSLENQIRHAPNLCMAQSHGNKVRFSIGGPVRGQYTVMA